MEEGFSIKSLVISTFRWQGKASTRTGVRTLRTGVQTQKTEILGAAGWENCQPSSNIHLFQCLALSWSELSGGISHDDECSLYNWLNHIIHKQNTEKSHRTRIVVNVHMHLSKWWRQEGMPQHYDVNSSAYIITFWALWQYAAGIMILPRQSPGWGRGSSRLLCFLQSYD